MTMIPDDDTGLAIKQWAAEGSDLTKPLAIDFFVAVPSQQIGNDFAKSPDLGDFTVSLEKDEETGKWTCYCTKRMIPDYLAIIDIERRLDAVASRFGAVFDGFGSFGNVDER